MIQRYDPFDGAMALSLAVSDGGFVFTSGMVGIAPDGTVPEAPEEEFRLIFSNLADVLDQMGVSCSAG
jgi:enamine deaminase RidA (YjgF/YER057c/UK114 family)